MRKIKVTRAQYRALQQLSRKDINTVRKNSGIVGAAKDLLRACRKVIKRIESIPEHASRRKRATAYKRVVHICRKAIDKASG
jgi:5-bromo-4-chloroindolyl phosphate hydrolysis protein